MRLQDNSDIFLEKEPARGSLQRPRRCYGALVAFYCVLLWRSFYCIPTEFLFAILCAVTTLSLRIYGAHNVCNAL